VSDFAVNPVAGGGRVYVSQTAGVSALNAQTGNVLWSTTSQAEGFGLMVYGDERLFGRLSGGRVRALNAATGVAIWTTTVPGEAFGSSTYDGATLYLISEIPSTGTRYLQAIDAAAGFLRWRVPAPRIDIFPGPSYAHGHLYGIGDDAVLRVVRASDGTVVEEHPLPGFSDTINPFMEVAVTHGMVFVADRFGGVHAFQGTLVDSDGDGDPDDGDCAPSDPAVHHGAAEICDGFDQDCVNGPDNGFDADGDGLTSCAGDCNDADPAVHPGATEVCNGVDDDCDAQTDEGFPDSDADGTRDCLDADDDNDGYSDAVDCAPLNPAVNPGVAEGATALATCFDVVDNDCDGTVDFDCAVEPSAQAVVTGSVTGVLADIRSISLDDTFERFTEAGGGTKKRLSVIWTFPGAVPGVPYTLRFEGYRNASANDTFTFGYAARSGGCADTGTYAPALTVSRAGDDGDALDSAGIGTVTGTTPLFCVRLADAVADRNADSVWVDRLFLFPAAP
jgi:hypothetical protein